MVIWWAVFQIRSMSPKIWKVVFKCNSNIISCDIYVMHCIIVCINNPDRSPTPEKNHWPAESHLIHQKPWSHLWTASCSLWVLVDFQWLKIDIFLIIQKFYMSVNKTHMYKNKKKTKNRTINCIHWVKNLLETNLQYSLYPLGKGVDIYPVLDSALQFPAFPMA